MARLCGKILFCLSMTVYAISFLLPTFKIIVSENISVSYGYDVFVIGFVAPLATPIFGDMKVFIPWLANPLLWVGARLFAMKHWHLAYVIGAIATALSATPLFGYTNRDLLLIGYFVWVISLGMFTLAAVIIAIWERP